MKKSKHPSNYHIIQYRLKDEISLETLRYFGYQVYNHDAIKEIIRNKRNEKIVIHCDMNKEFNICYYHEDECKGYVKYRQKKYLRDLLTVNFIEPIE